MHASLSIGCGLECVPCDMSGDTGDQEQCEWESDVDDVWWDGFQALPDVFQWVAANLSSPDSDKCAVFVLDAVATYRFNPREEWWLSKFCQENEECLFDRKVWQRAKYWIWIIVEDYDEDALAKLLLYECQDYYPYVFANEYAKRVALVGAKRILSRLRNE